MSLQAFLPLLMFAIVSTFTPGAATTLATASGAHFGLRRSIPVMAGAATGLATVVGASAIGLASVLVSMPSLQLAMKALGTLYLVWLALKIGRSRPPHLDARLARPGSFVGGAWLLWHNPKGWAMALGAAASFAALAQSPLHLALLLGLTFGLCAATSLVLWCMAGQALARFLKTSLQWRLLNIALGLLLVSSIIPMWKD
jgi:threonine/homoserine/homoserine lactone efflux protein